MKSKIFIGISYFILVFMLACDKADENPSGHSTIEGKITAMNFTALNVPVSIASRKINKNVSADSKGNYSFKNLPQGDYTVTTVFDFNDSTTIFHAEGSVKVQVNRDNESVIANIDAQVVSQPSGGGGGGSGGSCPYVYYLNGDTRVFCGDIYAGALYRSIERDDYLKLPAAAMKQSDYHLMITNELQETQFTDLAQLMVVEHPANVEVVLDKKGHPQSLIAPQPCRWALTDGGIDYAPYLTKEDKRSFDFNEEVSRLGFPEHVLDNFPEEDGMNTLTLSFDKPEFGTEAKLIISAKNSMWFTKVWEDFLHLFGTYYQDWNQDQKERSADELNEWSKQEGVPLLVYCETENGWEYLDCVDLVGSMKYRKMVIPFVFPSLKDKKVLRIKLKCAFNFWQLDYAAIDYSKNLNCSIRTVAASNIEADSVLLKLQRSDWNYMRHEKGEKQNLVFDLTQYKNKVGLSYFLHSKGYYEPVVKNENSPEYMSLLGFLWKGSMGKYSLEHFRAYREQIGGMAMTLR